MTLFVNTVENFHIMYTALSLQWFDQTKTKQILKKEKTVFSRRFYLPAFFILALQFIHECTKIV
jgi:hypothetical protein